jgi:hypothetical protein
MRRPAGHAAGATAPSSSGLGRRPLKAVTAVRIRSGLPPTTRTRRPLTWINEGRGRCCVSDQIRLDPAVGGDLCPFRARVASRCRRRRAQAPPRGSAPTSAPVATSPTAATRRPARGLWPPASQESAASPVRVWMRTVVVMSGTARRWTVAFWSPIAAASNAIITYRRAPPPPTGGPSARTPATATGRSSSSSVTVSQRRRTGAATWAPAGPTMLLASRPPAVAPTRNTASDTLGASTGNPCAPAAPKASSTTLPVMLAVKT